MPTRYKQLENHHREHEVPKQISTKFQILLPPGTISCASDFCLFSYQFYTMCFSQLLWLCIGWLANKFLCCFDCSFLRHPANHPQTHRTEPFAMNSTTIAEPPPVPVVLNNSTNNILQTRTSSFGHNQQPFVCFIDLLILASSFSVSSSGC